MRFGMSIALTTVLLLRLAGAEAVPSLEQFWGFNFLEFDETHQAWSLPGVDTAGRVCRHATYYERRRGALPYGALLRAYPASQEAWNDVPWHLKFGLPILAAIVVVYGLHYGT